MLTIPLAAIYKKTDSLQTYLEKIVFNLSEIKGMEKKGMLESVWKGWYKIEAKWVLLKKYMLIVVFF